MQSLTLKTLISASLATGFISSLVAAKVASDVREAQVSEWNQVQVIPPENAPPISQESIKTAMVMFGIGLPDNVDDPVLDRELDDRGLTSKSPLAQRYEVRIGPAAFTSWALLGSTLAHEIEVHCQQDFWFIALQDRFGLQGTSQAEREAYLHELASAGRFGLNPTDRQLIQETMEYYYPALGGGLALWPQPGLSARLVHSLRSWWNEL